MNTDDIICLACRLLAVKGVVVEYGNSVVECRTRNRESPCSNPPFAIISKFGHFRSLLETLTPQLTLLYK